MRLRRLVAAAAMAAALITPWGVSGQAQGDEGMRDYGVHVHTGKIEALTARIEYLNTARVAELSMLSQQLAKLKTAADFEASVAHEHVQPTLNTTDANAAAAIPNASAAVPSDGGVEAKSSQSPPDVQLKESYPPPPRPWPTTTETYMRNQGEGEVEDELCNCRRPPDRSGTNSSEVYVGPPTHASPHTRHLPVSPWALKL